MLNPYGVHSKKPHLSPGLKPGATDILSLRDKEIINEPKPFDL